MAFTTGTWLADLILKHLDALAKHLADSAAQRSAVYRNLAPDERLDGFRGFLQTLAETFRQNDLTPVRTYLEHITNDRLRRGVNAADIIALTVEGRDRIAALVEQESAGNQELATAALRQVQGIGNSVTLILSEINLRRLSTRPLQKPPGQP